MTSTNGQLALMVESGPRMAAVASCPHGSVFAAHAISERTPMAEAIAFLEAGPDDQVEIIPSSEARLRLGPCPECGPEGHDA